MKNYRITVNGNVYNATVESLDGSAPVAVAPAPVVVAPAPVVVAPAPVVAAPAAVAPAPAPVAPPPAPTPTPTPTPAAVPTAPGSGTKVESPMPGTVFKCLVNVGDSVSVNQVVAILEAMKMENEIAAPVAGTITSIVSPPGTSVNAGDVLMTIE